MIVMQRKAKLRWVTKVQRVDWTKSVYQAVMETKYLDPDTPEGFYNVEMSPPLEPLHDRFIKSGGKLIRDFENVRLQRLKSGV